METSFDRTGADELNQGLVSRIATGLELAGHALAARPWILLLAYAALVLPLTLLLSSRTPLAFDEVYTAYISRMPGMGAIWRALADGADLQPPLSYAASGLAQSMFGYSEWAIRLPFTLAACVAGLGLMCFVARRTNMMWGMAAALYILLSGAFPFAIVARPYAFLLAFASTGLVCWQAAAEGRSRKLALVGLSASLMLALSSHYYAVLLFFPFALAEGVRNFVNRKIDKPVWCSLLIAAPSVLLYLPLVRRSVAGVQAWKAVHVKMFVLWESYKSLGSSQAILGLFCLLIVGVFYGLSKAPARTKVPFPAAEIAVAMGLLALPIAGMALALTVTHAMAVRFVVALTLGAALVFVFAGYRLTGGTSAGALILSLALSGIYLAHMAGRVKSASLDGAESVALDTRYPDLPIVVGSSQDFAPAWYYASPELRSRMMFVSDGRMAERYATRDLANTAIAHSERFFHWRVETFDQFRPKHRRFLLNWTDGERWMLPVYLGLGARVEVLAEDLFLVTDDGSTSPVAPLDPNQRPPG